MGASYDGRGTFIFVKHLHTESSGENLSWRLSSVTRIPPSVARLGALLHAASGRKYVEKVKRKDEKKEDGNFKHNDNILYHFPGENIYIKISPFHRKDLFAAV